MRSLGLNISDNKLSEVEQRLMDENQTLRIKLEEAKALLNKNVVCQELSLSGSIKLLIDERNRATQNIQLLKNELKKIQVLLHNQDKDVRPAKEFLKSLLEKFHKLYEQ